MTGEWLSCYGDSVIISFNRETRLLNIEGADQSSMHVLALAYHHLCETSGDMLPGTSETFQDLQATALTILDRTRDAILAAEFRR